MVTRVQSWGNSQGFRLSKRILEDLRVSVGDEVDVVVRDGIILLTPVKRSRGKVSLRKLVSGGFQGGIDRKKPSGVRRWGGGLVDATVRSGQGRLYCSDFRSPSRPRAKGTPAGCWW